MKIVLTGITGNIGYEVARLLLKEGHTVVPIIRSRPGMDTAQRISALDPEFVQISEYISADLEKEVPNYSLKNVDCIIHCAGVVHFKKAGKSNGQMMENLLAFAKGWPMPIYYVSTAYLYKPHNEPLFNQYEIDKKHAEDILVSSLLSHSIIRPSIVTGNSETGKVLHFSGYYLTVPSFVNALKNSDRVRFPSIKTKVNIIPVDWVARSTVDIVINQKKGTFYVTNSNPPTCDALLKQTLTFFDLDHKLEIVDSSVDDYQKLDLSPSERWLFDACMPFIPYLTTDYDFPQSVCERDLDDGYIEKILRYFIQSKNEKLEK